jgi:hypothetical protein
MVKKSGQESLAIAAARELRQIIALMAKTEGPKAEVSIDLLKTQAWKDLRSQIIDALEDHPEARAALSEEPGATPGA